MKAFSWTEIVLLGGAWLALVVIGPLTGPEAWSWTRFAIAVALATLVAAPIVVLRLMARRGWARTRALFGWLAAPEMADLAARMTATVAAAGSPVPGVLTGQRRDRTHALLRQMLPAAPERQAVGGMAAARDTAAYDDLVAAARAAQAKAQAAGPDALGALLSAWLIAAEHQGQVASPARAASADFLGALLGSRAEAEAMVADALSPETD